VKGAAFRFTAPDGKRAAMESAKLGDKDGQLGLSEARDRARAYRLAVPAAEIVQSKKRLEPRFCSDSDIRIFRVSWRHRRRTNQRPLCANSRRSQIGFACDNGNTTREHKFCLCRFPKVNSTLRNHSFVALAL
jgi:hypothetical protein